MGYRNTIRSNVKKAFNLAGDLAIKVVLTKTTNAGFDFSTNAVVPETIMTAEVKGILVTTTTTEDGKSDETLRTSFLFKATEVEDANSYDTIQEVVSGKLWKIIPPCTNDGFITTAYCTRKTA